MKLATAIPVAKRSPTPAAPAAQSPTSSPALDTRSRILLAAQRLFRKRGYHATGLNDILDLAQAPKGSMYHHFPGGKEAIGVCVIEEISRALLATFGASRARSTQAVVAQAGEQLALVMVKTNYEICALFSAFAAERVGSPLLGAAVTSAYAQMVDTLQTRLVADGCPTRTAQERATVILALLEGGALLSQAQQSPVAFRLSLKQAALLAKVV